MMPKKKADLGPPPPGALTLPPGFSTPTTAPSSVAAREDMSVMDGSGGGSHARSPLHSSTTSLHVLPAICSNEFCPPSEVTGTWVQHCFSQDPEGKKVYVPSYPLDKTEYLPPMRPRSITCTYGPHSPLPEALNETSLTPNMAQRSGISDWLPTEDGIQILPPPYADNNSSVRKVIDNHINFRLYSPSQKPRLPVFREFCP